MSESNDNVTPLAAGRRLAEVVRSVKNAAADRQDVVIEMRDAERMRLEILASELAPIVAEVPSDMDVFDFAISSGLQPRFWIDGVSHVAMGRDKRVYRFVKDTRNGRIVLAESPDARTVANAVTRYVAERMVERERLIEGGTPAAYRAASPTVSTQPAVPSADKATDPVPLPPPQISSAGSSRADGGLKALLWALAVFALGCIFGFAVVATQWLAELTLRSGGVQP